MDNTADTVTQSEYIRSEIDDLIAREKDDFDAKFEENEDKLRDLMNSTRTLDDELIDLNEMVSSKA